MFSEIRNQIKKLDRREVNPSDKEIIFHGLEEYEKAQLPSLAARVEDAYRWNRRAKFLRRHREAIMYTSLVAGLIGTMGVGIAIGSYENSQGDAIPQCALANKATQKAFIAFNPAVLPQIGDVYWATESRVKGADECQDAQSSYLNLIISYNPSMLLLQDGYVKMDDLPEVGGMVEMTLPVAVHSA